MSDSHPLSAPAPGSTSQATGQEAGIDCLLCPGNGWPCVGLLLGVGSQFTGLSRVLELSGTCSSALLTFSNGWGNEARDCCL